MLSVNTNAGALVALQNLQATSTALAQAQNEVSTGLAISSPQDNGAIWAIAQNERGTSGSLNAVMSSLQRAGSTIQVATSAGTSVSNLLNQLKTLALTASDTSLDPTSLAATNTQFRSILTQITQIVSNSDFNGVNMIKSGGTTIFALATASGGQITVKAQDLSLGSANLGAVSANSSIGTTALATAMVASVNTAITKVNSALGQLGTGATALQNQLTFVQDLQDTLDTGIGNLVNANLGKESAQLTALQTKQQLGIQALSIANQSSAALLSLFR
ncbi:MAG TPA: flagellin, partial [Caulobacteraceae bacterium]|nr:flagellin [Caulobacteraceae bacterium]